MNMFRAFVLFLIVSVFSFMSAGLFLVVPDVSASTVNLLPNAAGSNDQWSTLVGSSKQAALSDSSDDTYIETDTKNHFDSFNIDNTGLGEDATINSIEIFIRATATGSGGAEKLRFRDILGATNRLNNVISITRTTVNEYSTGAITEDPNSDPWTVANLDLLEIGISANTLAKDSETLRVTDMWVVVDYTITDNRPVASSISIDSGAIGIDLTENTTTSVICTATVSDTEGYADITSVKAELYRSSVGSSAPDDNNDHYTKTGDSECAPSGGSGNTETYTCNFNVEYYADPTDAGPYNAQDWVCLVTPSDAGGEGTTDNDTIEMNSLAALDITPSISFGTLTLGTDTDASNQTLVITNTGNVNLDTEFSGNDMGCTTGTLGVANQKFGFSDVSYSSLTYALSSSAMERDTDIPQRTNDGSPSIFNTYWGLALPANGLAGSCAGTNTLTPVNDIGVD